MPRPCGSSRITSSRAGRPLERGAGLSTIAFALAGARHIAVTPSRDEVDRINKFCADSAISTQSVHFVVEGSETAIPALSPDLVLDFVLVDGAHSFPIPFLDWYYTSRLLRVGGWMVIDDIDLWTGRVLRDFMKSEPEWEFYGDVSLAKTAVFRKAARLPSREWCWQPYVVSRSALAHMIGSYELSMFSGVRKSQLARNLFRKGLTTAIARAKGSTRSGIALAARAFHTASRPRAIESSERRVRPGSAQFRGGSGEEGS